MAGTIRVGVGGWTYEPWRESFYPGGLPQKRELEYASRALTSIEINGTYYGAQKPETFARWREETPEDFVFSVKAPRFATNRRVLAEGAGSVERFLTGGLTELGPKLGPINWQFPATKAFQPDDFAAFLALLPPEAEGLRLRHVLEVRHESFRDPGFVEMAREAGVAVVLAADGPWPQIADPTADFVYLRLMGTREGEATGFSPQEIALWAGRAREFAEGGAPEGLDYVAVPGPAAARDVFVYVISGHKAANPAAAQALIGALSAP